MVIETTAGCTDSRDSITGHAGTAHPEDVGHAPGTSTRQEDPMGDRGNVYVMDGEVGVYLYSHWTGSELPGIVATALASPAGRNRWTDGQYLARIIFDHMTGGERRETGFGISARLGDNEHPIIVVDPQHQRVRLAEQGSEREAVWDDFTKDVWPSFEAFIAANPARG
jgi:hypothetical protein